MNARSTNWIALLAVVTLSACEHPAAPRGIKSPPPVQPPTGSRAGLVEITLTSIGTPSMQATAAAMAPAASGPLSPGSQAARGRSANTAQAGSLTVLPGNGTIQLQAVSTGSFTSGVRGSGGVRYLYASFRIRNAQSDGTPYTTARTNPTFLLVSTANTINGTPISSMRRFDGSAADPAIATGFVPTGAVYQPVGPGDGTIAARGPDVLQVLSEAEAGAIATGGGVTSVFPYGFVIWNPSTPSSRTLPANPAPTDFSGVVTIAFKVPLQATAAADPFTVSALFLAVDDAETRVTQSAEEQNPAAAAAAAARATALGATTVTLLPGWSYNGPQVQRCFSGIRTAGTAATPTTSVFPDGGVPLLSPNPYALHGGASSLPFSGAITATFATTLQAPTSGNFVVNASLGGRLFLTGGYTGGGTLTASTPGGVFLPGEEVEVTLTPTLAKSCAGRVAHFRVATASGPAEFLGGGFAHPVGSNPQAVAVGSLKNGGNLDLVVVNSGSNSVTVLRGDGTGVFGAAASFAVGANPEAVALGDLNGDGMLDIVVANAGSNTVSVLLGNAVGGFDAATSFVVGTNPASIAIGDVNGDGILDVVVANQGSNTVSVLLGTGAGGFNPARTFAAGPQPLSVAVGDLNGDMKLDLVVANGGAANTVSVLLGDGLGGFGAPVPMTVAHGPTLVALGDMNGDGRADLAVAGADATVSILLGDGSGGFGSLTSIGTFGQVTSLIIGDFDGDGNLDLAVATAGSIAGSNTVTVYVGDGTGSTRSFKDIKSLLVGPTPYLAVGDFNEDGALDIAVTSAGNSNVTTWLNQNAAQAVGSVIVTPFAGSIHVGQTAQAAATVRAVNQSVLVGRLVTWTSDQTTVATVSSSGLVTAVGVGTANITATSEGRNGQASVTVVP